MPGAKCKICSSDQRGAAETALASGESVRKVAHRLGLSYSSLERHRSNCVPKSIERVRLRNVATQDIHVAKADQEAAARAAQLGSALVARVERLQAITDLIIEGAMQGMALKAKDGSAVIGTDGQPVLAAEPGLALKAIAQARRNLELIGRLTGTLEPEGHKGEELITFEAFELLYRRVRLKA